MPRKAILPRWQLCHKEDLTGGGGIFAEDGNIIEEGKLTEEGNFAENSDLATRRGMARQVERIPC